MQSVHFFWAASIWRSPAFPAGARRCSPARRGSRGRGHRETYSTRSQQRRIWPGDNRTDYPAFILICIRRRRLRDFAVQPSAAFFSEALGEFLLPYDAVRTAADPDAVLLAFFQSTYEAAAQSAHWDRVALECPRGVPGVPRDMPE